MVGRLETDSMSQIRLGKLTIWTPMPLTAVGLAPFMILKISFCVGPVVYFLPLSADAYPLQEQLDSCTQA
jgi:hypothetical protein